MVGLKTQLWRILNQLRRERSMTRLELIAEICKRMADDLKEDNDRAEEREQQREAQKKMDDDEIY